MSDDVLDGLGHVGKILVRDISSVDDGAQVVESTVEAGGVARKADQSKLDGLTKGGGHSAKLTFQGNVLGHVTKFQIIELASLESWNSNQRVLPLIM